MKRRRKNKRKERMIMLGSSVMVLSALTITGLYVKEKKEVPKEEYVVDLSELEVEETNEYVYDNSGKEDESKEVSSQDIISKEDKWTVTAWELEDVEEEEEAETEAEEEAEDTPAVSATTGTCPLWVTALSHKILYNSMETDSVIKTFFYKTQKVFTSNRCLFGTELNNKRLSVFHCYFYL